MYRLTGSTRRRLDRTFKTTYLLALGLAILPIVLLLAHPLSGQGATSAAIQIPVPIATSTATHTGTSLTINAPPGAIQGTDVEVAVISYQNAGTITKPSSTWTLVAGAAVCNGTSCQAIYAHVVSASEPSSYTWTCSTSPNQFNGGIVDFRNVNTTTPVDSSSTSANPSGSTLSLSLLAPTVPGELAILAISGSNPLYVTTPLNGLTNLWNLDQAGGWGALVQVFPQFNKGGTAINAQYVATNGNTFAAQEIFLVGATGATNPVHTIGSDESPVTSRGNAADGSNTIDGYSVNSVYNVESFGATPDGSTDSSGAFQTALNTACSHAINSSGLASKPGVFVPAGTYLLLKPVILHCGANGIRLFGAGKLNTSLVMTQAGVGSSYGPALVAMPTTSISSLNSGTITGTALASGSGQSLFWYDSSVPFVLDLGQVMRSISLTPLNGLTALDVRFFAKSGQVSTDTSSATYFFTSDGKLDLANCNTLSLNGAYSCRGAWQVFVDQNQSLWLVANVSGTSVAIHSANNAWTLNSTHEVEGVFDGSNVCLFLDGTRVATATQSGIITQRPDEDMLIGEDAQVFPTTGPVGRIWFSGAGAGGGTYLDSFEIRKVIPSGRSCSNSSYTADTSKFTGDTNSLLLLNFDNLLDVNGNTTNTSPALVGADWFNGTDMVPSHGPSGQGAWLAIRNEGLVSGESVTVSDLGIAGATIGILGIISQGSNFDNLQLSGTYAGLFLTNLSYNNEEANVTFNSSALAAFVAANNSGLTSASNIVIGTAACGWSCLIDTGGGGVWNKVYMAPQSTTAWEIVVNNIGNSASSWEFTDPTEDVEHGGTAGAIWYAGPGAMSVHSGGLGSAGTTPLITVGPSGTTNVSDIFTVNEANLGISNSAGEVVNSLATFSSGALGQFAFRNVLFSNNSLAPPSAVPWSNVNTLVSLDPLAAPIRRGTQTTSFSCDYGSGNSACIATLGANNLQVTLSRPLPNIDPIIRLCEDSTGSRTPTLAPGLGVSAIKLAGGSLTFTTAANKCDQITFSYDGTNLNEVSRALNQ
jgi:hypothetical protein